MALILTNVIQDMILNNMQEILAVTRRSDTLRNANADGNFRAL